VTDKARVRVQDLVPDRVEARVEVRAAARAEARAEARAAEAVLVQEQGPAEEEAAAEPEDRSGDLKVETRRSAGNPAAIVLQFS